VADRLARTLAARLREERRRSGLSLRALAVRSGLSTTTVHQIEAGRGSPSLATLHALAATLGVALPSLLADRAAQGVAARGLRARGLSGVRTERGELGRLAAGLARQRLHGLVLTLAPGGTTGPEPMSHAGQEMVFGLAGACIYEVAGAEYRIGPGDSVVLDSRQPHRARNPGRRPARVLLVLYAPGRRSPPAHAFATAAPGR
jgi:transcriptional regulator with XRE-family HTH domain